MDRRQFTGSWVLTGEDASFRGAATAHLFIMDGERLGTGLELVPASADRESEQALFSRLQVSF